MTGHCGSSRASLKLGWGADAEETTIEAESAAIEERLRNLPERFRQGPIPFGHSDDTEEEPNEDEVIPALADVIDLTGDAPVIQQRSQTQTVRNSSVPLNAAIEHYKFNGVKLEPGSTVEIRVLEQPQLFKASFLHIKHIINTPDGIKLRGIALTRLKNLRGRLPRLRNEVAMILHVDSDDKRTDEVQAAIEVPITDVINIRNCHFTNADFPMHRTVIGIHDTPADLQQQGVLMCRWRCIFKYRDSVTRIDHINQTRKNAAPLEYIVQHLNTKQVSKKRFKVPEISRFNRWRGGKVRGGEHDPESGNGSVRGPVVQLDGEEDPELVLIEKKPGQRYTFGDMFCGAGGASCGAQKAGFHVKVACDHHSGACKTYTEAFPDAQLYMMDIFEFIISEYTKTRVDVLHLSPPCQFWSPAHTCAGVNDDANIAALFSCHELIRKLRPRLFTLEQTFGILHPQFEYYFNALVNGFTENNYSVRWKIVDLVDWGSPATRKRLIMIGSCPGEDLPPFPEATHVAPGVNKKEKKPYVTVQKMLARIPRGASQYDDMHQPQDMVRKRLPRWDPDVTLRRCITTNGGYGNYHPNGRRDFTLREYATLQTFPVDYPFQYPDKKKQIGNAFPPQVVKVLYTHLRKWLDKQDCVYAIENEPIDSDDPDIEILDLENDGLMDEISDDEDVEYVGSQYFSSSSSSNGSIYHDDMDLDMGDGDYLPVLCVDANQRQRRRIWPTVETARGSAGKTQDYIDLTGDEE
ncbi:S-adenosyl-L-methionine-dependent methyltransferase [Xylaria longipes]|nr:S-adenosyl-L-methionine-dependent methyltransferase [Xylaria longipes]